MSQNETMTKEDHEKLVVKKVLFIMNFNDIFGFNNDKIRSWVFDHTINFIEFHELTLSAEEQRTVLFYALKHAAQNSNKGISQWVYVLAEYEKLDHDVFTEILSLKNNTHFLYILLFKNPAATASDKDYLFNLSYKIRQEIAGKTNDPQMIEALLLDSSLVVRKELLKNRHVVLNPEYLARLQKDKNKDIKQYANELYDLPEGVKMIMTDPKRSTGYFKYSGLDYPNKTVV